MSYKSRLKYYFLCFDNYIDVDLDMHSVEADHHFKISQQL